MFLTILTLCSSGFAQQTLSPEAKISAITLGPWPDELYAAFGHSAYRVYDPVLGIDYAYNYGVFDFDQPNFYLNFARGFLYYKLGVYPYRPFIQSYIFENRFVHEQELNLTAAQKQKVYDYLEWNALPENQHYRYDYFYDNCATKIRDVMVEALGDSVFFDGSYIIPTLTIRELTDLYLDSQPWGDLGIDICLGLPMDRVIPPYDYMFLPDYIESGFDHAYVFQGGERKPLVADKKIIYESLPAEPPAGLPHPLWVFGALCAVAIFLSWYDIRKNRLSRWFDIVLFGVVGAIGLLLVVLWLFTDHRAAARNLNVLWALPTHLGVAALMFSNAPWLRGYFLVTAILGISLLFTWGLLPQGLNTSLIPVVVALTVRAATGFYVRKRHAVVVS